MREFTVGAAAMTVANQPVSLVFINPPAAPNVNIQIVRAWVSQSANATSAQQRVQHARQVSVFPTLTSATPQKLKGQDAVSVITGGTAGAAGTCGTNASAEGAGTKTAIFDDAFNVLNGYLWVPTPSEVLVQPAGSLSGYSLFLPVAPVTLTNWHAGVNFQEV